MDFAGDLSIKILIGVIDVIVLTIIFTIIKKKTKNITIKNLSSGIYMWLLIATIAFHFNFTGIGIISAMLGVLIPILRINAYPQKYRDFLDDYKGRRVNSNNTEKLLSKESLNELVQGISELSRKQIGSAIVITREDRLTEIEESGILIGEIEIKADMLESLFNPLSPYSKGAVVIRDNKIVAVNCYLPEKSEDVLLEAGHGHRHFGLLGVVDTTDAVSLGTSSETGGISINGTTKDNRISFALPTVLREFDLKEGISDEYMKHRITTLLTHKGLLEDFNKKERLEAERLAKADERKHRKSRPALTREEKIAERNNKRNKEGL